MRGTPSIQPQLEKIHDIPPSTPDEAPFPCSASRAIPSSLSKLEGRLDSLYAIQEVPQDTCHNSKGVPFLATTWDVTRVHQLILRWQLIPLLRLKGNPDFLLVPQGEACFTYGNSRGTPRFLPKFERTQSSTSTRDKNWYACTDWNGTPSNLSKHEMRSDSPTAPLEKVQVSYFDPQQHPTYVPSEVKFAQSCLTLCDPMDYTFHEFSRPDYWSG